MSAALVPDRELIARFVDALFRHADRSTFLALRVFGDRRGGDAANVALFEEGVRLDAPDLVDRIVAMATRAAEVSVPAVFALPVASFQNAHWARTQDLADGVALVVDCDANPVRALAALIRYLGPPTLVVESGGLWANPITGEEQLKVHAYWRLAQPARSPEDNVALRAARKLAADLIGSDATAASVAHPMRWPGSWHRKGTPRLARIVQDDDVELRLADALDRLRAVPPGEFVRQPMVSTKAAPNPHKTAASADIAAALKVIPNDDVAWADWNRLGMAVWLAVEGDPHQGFDSFDEWSSRSTKYDPAATEARWEHYASSPPTQAGAGTVFHLARKFDPEWVKPSERFDVTKWFDAEASKAVNDNVDIDAVKEPNPSDGSNEPIISEDEAGIRFAEEYRGRLHYSKAHGKWFVWDGTIWRENSTDLAFHYARVLIRKMAEDHPEKVRIAAGKAAFAGAVERYARADPTFAVTAEAWDQDPWLLGTPRGTVDLCTGELRPARPEDGITRSTAVAPADAADCPLWLRLLDETFAGDAATVRFFQQWAGYSLTGDTREQSLVFGHGEGGNGKGVTINTIGRIAGTYTVTAAAETFVASFGSRHSTELAMLAGARIVKASEMEKGQVWAEKRIKEITGGDEITARFMRQDNFTFLPTFKLIIIGNDIPDLNQVDDAMRRRFNLLPFLHKPSRPDPGLIQKLEAEWPAILRWMIDGCLDWQRNGLLRPECVLAATRDYFSDQDTMAHWAAESCTIDRDNDDLREATARLYASWSSYAKGAGVGTGSEKAFARDLRTRFRLRPREKIPLPSGSRVRGFSGIALRAASFHEVA